MSTSTNTAPAISFKNVSKSFSIQDDKTIKDILPALVQGKSWARKHAVLSSVSFEISTGESVGIVGKNGAGKSTILKLIAGVTYPSSGTVTINGTVAPLIELGAGFHHELTGIENIYLNGAILGLHKQDIESKIAEIVHFSELGEYIHEPVKRYSSGMYMRLAFSVAIHVDAPILLIDEVLGVGDIEFQEKCLKRLHEIRDEHTKTIIFISHDQEAVQSFCERAILLRQGKVIADDIPTKIFTEYHKVGNSQ